MNQAPPEPLRSFGHGTAAMALELSRLGVAAKKYRATLTSGGILANAAEAIRVEVTYNSNAIEGNTLSLRETQLVLEGQAPGGKSMREIYEARNHDRAMRLIERWISQARGPIAEQSLLEVHAVVLSDIDPREAGKFRSGRALIAGSRFVPPGPQKVAELVPRALEMSGAAGVHPALAAAELHYNLVAIHPFADGNGRTARLMMNYHMLRHGFPWTIIEVSERAAYMAALEEANAGKTEAFGVFIIRSATLSIERLLGD